MKEEKSKIRSVLDEIEAEFGGPGECKNCLKFERFVEDPVTKTKYTKCKSFDYLSNPNDAYRCGSYSHKDPKIRKNVADMIKRGAELERSMRPTWEDLNRPFTI